MVKMLQRLRPFLPVLCEGAGFALIIVTIGALVSPWIAAAVCGLLLIGVGYVLEGGR